MARCESLPFSIRREMADRADKIIERCHNSMQVPLNLFGDPRSSLMRGCDGASIEVQVNRFIRRPDVVRGDRCKTATLNDNNRKVLP